MASISQEAHSHFEAKKEEMRQVHNNRLVNLNLVQHQAAPPPLPRSVEHYSIANESDGYQTADEGEEPQQKGPSMASRVASGIKNHAWPFTRDILAPATGDLAVHLGTGAAWLIGKSFWSLADIIWALNAKPGDAPPETGDTPPAIEGGGGYGFLGNGSSSSSSGVNEEEDELSKKSKGYLVEEIYKQPGWARMFGREDARGYTSGETAEFRKKLGKMSSKELAETLTALKSRG